MRRLDKYLKVELSDFKQPKAKSAGLLKMKVRVIREEDAPRIIKETPPPQLRKLYAERITKVRAFRLPFRERVSHVTVITSGRPDRHVTDT